MNVSGLGTSSLLSDTVASSSNTATSSTSSSNASSNGDATSFTDSISLSSGAIDQTGGLTPSAWAADADKLFSFFNSTILNDNSLAGVGNAIDLYEKALPGSTQYLSAYTAPSAQYLGDLANLKSAADSGNLEQAQAVLAQAKLDAPQNITGAFSEAKSKGDITGETAVLGEVVANTSNYLVFQGYSSTGATAEAIAVTINSLTGNAANTTTSSAQTRVQQITDIAENVDNTQLNAPLTSNDPLFKIFETLLESNSGTAIDQSLTNLDAVYGSNTSIASENNS